MPSPSPSTQCEISQNGIILSAEDITKVFPGTTALDAVNFKVYRGKVNVLVGENGAGKSTLMKILAGVELPTSGRLLMDGHEVTFRNTREASKARWTTSNNMKMTIRWKRFASCVPLLSLTWILCLRSIDSGWTEDQTGDAVGANAQAENSLDLRGDLLNPRRIDGSELHKLPRVSASSFPARNARCAGCVKSG